MWTFKGPEDQKAPGVLSRLPSWGKSANPSCSLFPSDSPWESHNGQRTVAQKFTSEKTIPCRQIIGSRWKATRARLEPLSAFVFSLCFMVFFYLCPWLKLLSYLPSLLCCAVVLLLYLITYTVALAVLISLFQTVVQMMVPSWLFDSLLFTRSPCKVEVGNIGIRSRVTV